MNSILKFLNYKNWGVKDYSDKGDFDSAYSNARSSGEKEFMWNGKRYSSNYKGTPEQQLKETGITNEQLQNRGKLKRNISNNIFPFNYEYNKTSGINYIKTIQRGLNSIVEKDKRRLIIENLKPNEEFKQEASYPINYEDSQKRLDALYLYSGKPQHTNTFTISKYRPTKGDDNKNTIYYSLNNDKFYNNLIKQYPKPINSEKIENLNKKYNFSKEELGILNNMYFPVNNSKNYNVYEDPITKGINLFMNKSIIDKKN